MLELAKSSLSFSWAMSLFGVQQIANTLSPRELKQPTRETQAAFDWVTQATANQLDDLFWAAYQVGDDLQRGAVNLTFDVLTLRAFAPGYINRLASDIAHQSQDTLRILSSETSLRLALDELKNNYEVFNLVRNIASILNIPSGPDFPIEELIEKAYALGEFPDLWAIEGLGHDYAMSFWATGKPIQDILTDQTADRLPAKSLTMMHAGIGLAFAQQLMNTVTPLSSMHDIRGVLQEFITLCKNNARRGYIGAAYESLGLVTRFWHPQMVPIVDRHLPEIEPEALSYFWHGAGRALYFLPIYFVPGLMSPWRAAEREPSHKLARLNMLSGLAWATTLVNIRQPAIMANLLKYQGAAFFESDAFSNGVLSALTMAHDITPGDVYITDFLGYKPDPSNPQLVDLWNNFVVGPASFALERYYPILKERGQLGEVFHYQSQSELLARLEGETLRAKPSP